MRHPRRWDHGDFSEPQPICFSGWPGDRRPSSFPFLPILENFTGSTNPPAHLRAHIAYRKGWTGLLLWNGEVFFAEQILTFDAMMELVRKRFRENYVLAEPITREYVD